jgi:hypothetical protein
MKTSLITVQGAFRSLGEGSFHPGPAFVNQKHEIDMIHLL